MHRDFATSCFVRSTPEHVFQFVADYRNVGPLLEGVRRWEPIGRRSRGVGARYRVEISALGIGLSDILQLDVWDEPHAIGWRSAGGVMEQTGRWEFRPRRGGVDVTLSIGYDPPAGALGNALAGPIEALVRRRVSRAVERMRDAIEEEAGSGDRVRGEVGGS